MKIFSTTLPYIFLILVINIFLQLFKIEGDYKRKIKHLCKGLINNTHCYISIICGICFSTFTVIGNLKIFDKYGWLGVIVSFIIWFVLYQQMFIALVQITDTIMVYNKYEYKDYIKWGIGTFIVLCVIDGIFLLVFYPGSMYYDTFVQMCQATGGSAYSNHHAWLHTLMMKFTYELGLLIFNNSNKAYATFIICNIMLISSAFSFMIMWLRKKGMKTIPLIIVYLMIVLSPINQMFSINGYKDVPFAAFVIYWVLLLSNILDDLNAEKNILIWKWCLFILLSFLVCYSRTNGYYMFLGMIPILVIALRKKIKSIITAIIFVLILGVIYKGPIFTYFEVKEPDIIESLSIPAQQIAAVYYYDGVVHKEQNALLEEIVDTSRLKEEYGSSPTCSDNIKNLVREKNSQQIIREKADIFLKLWVELFWENKRIYVKAYVNQTSGYWYHHVKSPFLWATYIEPNGMGIERDSKVPENIEKAFRQYLKVSEDFFDIFLSVGLYMYIFLFSMFIAWKKKNKYILLFIPFLGIWGTLLIATPVYADIRYAYAIYAVVPFLMSIAFMKRR